MKKIKLVELKALVGENTDVFYCLTPEEDGYSLMCMTQNNQYVLISQRNETRLFKSLKAAIVLLQELKATSCTIKIKPTNDAKTS